MEIDLNDLGQATNEAFYPLYKCKDRYLVLWGGAGSGKSYFAAEKILVRCLVGIEHNIKHKFLCLRKTQPATRKSIFALFEEYISNWGLSSIVHTNRTMMEFTFTKGPGTQIICGGLDDPEKLKSIVGVTSVWLEEATEMNVKDFTQVDLRLRGITPSYKQILISFNPISETNWVKKRFFDSFQKSDIVNALFPKSERRKTTMQVRGKAFDVFTTLHHSTYKDNRFIDSQYIAILEDLVNKDRNFHNVYALGKWGVLKGLIYDNWDTVSKWPDKFEKHGFGLDFGFSNSPSALIEVGIIGNEIWEREHIYETGLTNQDIAGKMKMCLPDDYNLICADSAEPKSIQEIKNCGWNIFPSNKGKDSVVHGIQLVKQHKVHVLTDSINLIKEKESYKWAEDKDGEIHIPEKPVGFMNHLMDAERYIVTKLIGKVPAGIYVPQQEKETFDDIMDNEAVWQEY